MTKIERLIKSPIYAMTFGSKELFNSNFWYYLIKNEHAFAKVFFSDINPFEISHIERESKNRDLVIIMNNGLCYVVENKIKSIPSNKQLNEYKKRHYEIWKWCFTGIKETLQIEDLTSWHFLAYKEISKSIRRIAEKSQEEVIIEHKNLIYEYCDVIVYISDIVLEKLDKTRGYLNYEAEVVSQRC